MIENATLVGLPLLLTRLGQLGLVTSVPQMFGAPPRLFQTLAGANNALVAVAADSGPLTNGDAKYGFGKLKATLIKEVVDCAIPVPFSGSDCCDPVTPP